MRHLIVCCDGTWNTRRQRTRGVPTPSNVVRLYNALAEKDTNGEEQRRFYRSGVGTQGGLANKIRGGTIGEGLTRNIISAYRWLAVARHDDPEAVISLFGFSRGAYTARNLARLITDDDYGLVDLSASGIPPDQAFHAAELIYDSYHSHQRPPRRYRFCEDRTVRFLGVWDTVGAVGIPKSVEVMNFLDREKFIFENTKLSDHVLHGRHAVALDEIRGPFAPTLWDPRDDTEHTSLRQVWFPGNHRDVGGGHPETGLSDHALQWMIDEAHQYAGLNFLDTVYDQIQPDATDVLHDDCTGFYRLMSSQPRRVPLLGEQNKDVLHESVFARQRVRSITMGRYRPSETLAPGQQHTVKVLANEPWNETGMWLEPGTYDFHARGQWIDRTIPAGPDGGVQHISPNGDPSSRSHHHRLARLLRTLNLPVEWALSIRQRKKRAARYPTTRRVLTEDNTPGGPLVPWMCLIGVIANADLSQDTGMQNHTTFRIGSKRTDFTVRKPGYLYAFANDAWGFYVNNQGSVQLTVQRRK